MTLSREFRFITHTHVCGSPHTLTGLPPHVPPSWVPVGGSVETHTDIADMAAKYKACHRPAYDQGWEGGRDNKVRKLVRHKVVA